MQYAPINTEPAEHTAASVYDSLRADLLMGRWRPGQKLRMHALRAHYGIGASPLREALNRLASEGLAIHTDQRGFTVASASVEQLDDLVRTRISLESLALAQAFERRNAQWEEHVLLTFHRLARTQRSLQADHYEENPEWEQYHRAFHFALLENCGSPLLLGFCAQMYDQAYRYRQLAAGVAHGIRNAQDEHQVLFDCVIQDRLEDAQAMLSEHYRRTAAIYAGGVGS